MGSSVPSPTPSISLFGCTVYFFCGGYLVPPGRFFLARIPLKPWMALLIVENATRESICFEQRAVGSAAGIKSRPPVSSPPRLVSIHGLIDPPVPVWIVLMCPCAHSFLFCCLCSSSAVRLRALAGAIRVLRRGWGGGRGAVGSAYPEGRGTRGGRPMQALANFQ